MEDNLGPLVPMEVVIRFRNDGDVSLWRQPEIVRSIESAIKQTTEVNATYSAATFRPPISRSRGLRGEMQKRLTIKKWETEFDRLEEANLVRRLPDENLWRISLRVM